MREAYSPGKSSVEDVLHYARRGDSKPAGVIGDGDCKYQITQATYTHTEIVNPGATSGH
ncbi:MAG: hypothetical protein IPL01_21940 [Acidobacteria bacterium]|nr:hypothetical protein [Acidobacteriota bacterium]